MKILADCYREARELLAEHREKLEALAGRLLEQEKIDASDLQDLLGPRPE